MRSVCGVAGLVLAAAVSSHAFAAGWTQPKGKTQAIVTARYYTTDEYFDNSGHSQSQPTYDKYEINPYFEYGLTDTITLGANVFLDYVSQDVPGALQSDNYGLSDTELFARFRVYKDEANVFSLQPLIKLPSVYSRSGSPRSGGDQTDIELAAQGGHNFSLVGVPAFTTLSAAYRHRFEDPADQVKLDWVVGAHLTDRFMLLPQLSYTGRVNAPVNPAFTQSGSDDYNLLKLQLSAVYSITPDWSAELGVFDHVSGKNTGSGGGVTLAVWKQF